MKLKNIKNIITLFCLIISIFSIFQYSYAQNSNKIKDLNINSRNYVIFDRLSNTVIFGKNEKQQVKMASTTKIMTAIIVIQKCNLDDVVKISKNAASIGGSTIGLKENDLISINNLLYGLLLSSGNDAAIALAEHTSGTVENFCKLMNNMAYELNLYSTNFESPHGLDSKSHYTTAEELAILTDFALENPIFSKIISTKNFSITINDYTKNLSNTNELLGNFTGIYGVKTGFTNGANRCLVTACIQNNMDIICVVLGADTKNHRSSDTKKLLTYTFENYSYFNYKELILKNLVDLTSLYPTFIHIDKGTTNKLYIHTENLENNILPLTTEEISSINVKYSFNANLSAPISYNQSLGYFIISNSISNNKLHNFKIGILSESNIPKNNIKNYFFYFFSNYISHFSNII